MVGIIARSQGKIGQEYHIVNVISARVSARALRADTRPRAETKGWDHIYRVMLFVSYT